MGKHMCSKSGLDKMREERPLKKDNTLQGENGEVRTPPPHSLHPEPYTLHPEPYTLHPTP